MNLEKNIRIDYSKYEVEEVAETIADAILFPLYIGRVLLLVVVFFIVLIGFLAYFCTDHFILFFFFFILSYVISLPSIVLISGVRLINTIKDDINKVFEICIDTTMFVYEDSKLLVEQYQSNLPLSATFKDIFRGVAIYVIRPSLKKVLKKRIKFMSVPFIFLIDQIFRIVVIKRPPEFNIENTVKQSFSTNKVSLNSKIKRSGNKITNVTLGIITIPIYAVLFIYGSLNMIIVWLFSLLF